MRPGPPGERVAAMSAPKTSLTQGRRSARYDTVRPMQPERLLHWTVQDYLSLEANTSEKHEFLDGEIFAMGGARSSHNVVALRVGAAFVSQLRGRSCMAFNSDQRIHIPTTGLYTYADGGVVCGRFEHHSSDGMSLVNPTLLFEVLSPSTRDYDRGVKLEHYKKIPTLREVLLIDQPERRFEHHRRVEGDRWVVAAFTEGAVALALGMNLELADVYEGIEFTLE
jgi:Uma2 family endonuclease